MVGSRVSGRATDRFMAKFLTLKQQPFLAALQPASLSLSLSLIVRTRADRYSLVRLPREQRQTSARQSILKQTLADWAFGGPPADAAATQLHTFFSATCSCGRGLDSNTLDCTLLGQVCVAFSKDPGGQETTTTPTHLRLVVSVRPPLPPNLSCPVTLV